MLLSTFLLAVSVQVTPPDSARPWVPTLEAARTACPRSKVAPAADNVRRRVIPLGEAPPARLQYAVLRSVGGCPAPTFVRRTRSAR